MTALTDCQIDKGLIVAGFHALSDPLRLQIVTLLQKRELCVCDLCERLAVSQSKLSFHLKVLRDANLIRARQQGRWMYYRLNPAQLLALGDFIKNLQDNCFAQVAPPCP
ncbi:MAG: metalloregulator ArsR/SmtB family transcription factor [Pseudanabaenaceae cyanobacterium SKYGB_i_bin29]|nr:metalloregulator ArsR/SmtB family transcription factor [Pseudanabaenaceae cyanobacterium SKYG29]MDW8421503.1 metalloregulator ArsR/SmtB family transcription factor [Pseudanabaenaceae cyanobacterium SKYGB_i_bin29]